MSEVVNVSRRRFVTGGIIAAGALVLGVRYYSRLSPGDKLPHDTNADQAKLHPKLDFSSNNVRIAAKACTASRRFSDSVLLPESSSTRSPHAAPACASVPRKVAV